MTLPTVRAIPLGARFWPDGITASADPAATVARYAAGFAGVWHDPAADAELRAAILAFGGLVDAADTVAAYGLTGAGEGKLSLLFPAMLSLFPGCLPGAAQERGDCVAHCSKNAALASLANEIAHGRPDEITGRLEGPPDIPPEGLIAGALSTEYLYWQRGYNGDGWSCAAAAEKIRQEGMLLRKPYPTLGLDLTRYSGDLAGRYGAKPPPAAITTEGRLHCVRQTTIIGTFAALRDLIATGCGVASCGPQGFHNVRDANGFAPVRGSWAHAMPFLGVDDRAEIHALYNGPLVLVQNSWGRWNTGPRRILGTALDIPDGSFWARWADVSTREMIAYSSVDGWPRRKLPDYGFSVLG